MTATWARTGLQYAYVGGPPENWYDLRVVDLDSHAEVDRVLEVNCAEGWVRQLYIDEATGCLAIDGVNGERRMASRTVQGRFSIEERREA